MKYEVRSPDKTVCSRLERSWGREKGVRFLGGAECQEQVWPVASLFLSLIPKPGGLSQVSAGAAWEGVSEQAGGSVHSFCFLLTSPSEAGL